MSNKREKCPICNLPGQNEFLPFCSARCKLIDLNKWLKGGYYIPGSDEEDRQNDQKDEQTL